jgi:hypothetical protein
LCGDNKDVELEHGSDRVQRSGVDGLVGAKGSQDFLEGEFLDDDVAVVREEALIRLLRQPLLNEISPSATQCDSVLIAGVPVCCRRAVVDCGKGAAVLEAGGGQAAPLTWA